MTALPVPRASAEAREVASPSPEPPRARELTLRALLLGCAIGAVLAAGNVYTGLKTSFIDGGSITAALLGFTFFSTFRRLARTPYAALEANITQTTAASAGIMAFVLGLPGPIAALHLRGRTFPWWTLAGWGLAVGLVGIFIATSLRKKLIVAERLPFPTGSATAEVIETMCGARASAVARARLLLLAALLAMLVTWFRDGLTLVPQATYLPLSIGGLTAATLTLGLSWSPLLAGTGIFMGLRAAASMALGAALAWGGLAPVLVDEHLVPSPTYGALVSWLAWPGVGLMLSSTFTPLLLDWRAAARSLRDLPMLLHRRLEIVDGVEAHDRLPFQRGILILSIVAVLWIGWLAFALPPVITGLTLLLSVVFAAICGRAAGETDLAPIGSAGTLTQVVFGGSGPDVSLVAGSISSGEATQTSQTLWALKAGHRLKASARAQVMGQILGALVGSVVAVPVYLLLISVYGLGTAEMPAPSALSWTATAEAVQGGLARMPPFAPLAAGLGIAAGAALCLVSRTRLARFAPSPMAMGIACLIPASLSFAALVGAAAVALVRRRRDLSDGIVAAVAAGAIAGESVMGVVTAALRAIRWID